MELLSCVLISAGALLFGLYLYLKHKFSYWSDKRVKCVQPSTILGNLYGVGYSVHYVDRLKEIYEKFCDTKDLYCGVFFMTTPKLMALNLDFVEEVMKKDFQTFHDRGVYHNEKCDPLSGNLFNLEGEQWSSLRSKLSPIFTPQKMKVMFESVQNIGDELYEVIEMHDSQKLALNAKDICERFAVDVIGAYTLGLQSQALKTGNSNILDVAKKIYNYRSPIQKGKFILQNSCGDLSRMIGLKTYSTVVDDFFKASIEKTVKYRQINDYLDRTDFLSLLLQIQKDGMIDGDQSAQNLGTFSTTELTIQVFTMFLAGFDTLASTMTFCLFELSMNEKLQDEARKEVLAVLKKNNGRLTYESLSEMEYMERVVKETLRKYSPVHTIYRRAKERYNVSGTDIIIPTGTQMIIPVYAIHNDPKIYENPGKFDPDRFTKENMASRHRSSFLAFGDGPRNCIGQQFGILNLKLGLSMMLSKHKFTVNMETETPLKLDPVNLLLEAKGGILLNVYKL